MRSDRIRVLVVDDSALMRRMISDIIESNSRLVVVGTARDGLDAIRKVEDLQPDVITMDIEMPAMNGLAALEQIMQRRPTPVVMLSSRTAHGAEETLRSLELGAVDFVCKPSGSTSVDIKRVKDMLITKLQLAATARLMPSAHQAPVRPTSVSTPAHGSRLLADRVVTIGSSTGGPRALEEIIPRLPRNLPSAVLVAQHMPHGFTAAMARRLDALSAVEVREAADDDLITCGTVLIGPGGKHLVVRKRGRVAVMDGPPLWGVRPAADTLMASAAKTFGPSCIGVILTGMGQDGAEGIAAIHRAGGKTIAQDESTSVIYGMPKAAVATGAVDISISLPMIASSIARLSRCTHRHVDTDAAPATFDDFPSGGGTQRR